jgi:hypothetical protein
VRKYKIYLLENDIASLYFGKESKLYHLFLEYERATEMKRSVIQKQIHYISKPIPSLHIRKLLNNTLNSRTDYRTEREGHVLKIVSPPSQARLVINESHILLQAEGSFEAETIFFEVLRKYDPCFLAMDFQLDRYGWLNPIKQRKFV